jgi:branched-subunit amino acid ABC-type transport system permease component
MPSFGVLLPFLIEGIAFGAMYAVTGTSLVVLYRTTGVVNLAFGAIGAMAAHIAWSVMGGTLKKPTPIVGGIRMLGYPLLVIICAGITLLYGMWIAPKLARRDPLVKALGMLGVALIFLGIMKQTWDSSKPRGISLPTKRWKLGEGTITSTQIVCLLLAICVVLGVNAFLNKTATGTAMRAIANDRDVSALLGVPVRRVEAFAWALSGVICGCVFLLFPALFKSMDQGTLTWFVIGALAGAVVGQFKNLWVTLIASLLIGTFESGFAAMSGNLQFLKDYRKITPFLVAVLAILWISRRRTIVLGGREMS